MSHLRKPMKLESYGWSYSQSNPISNKSKETQEKNFMLSLPIIPEHICYFIDSKSITREVDVYLIDTQLSFALSDRNVCHLPMFSKLINSMRMSLRKLQAKKKLKSWHSDYWNVTSFTFLLTTYCNNFCLNPRTLW